MVAYIQNQGGTKSRTLLRDTIALFRLAEHHQIQLETHYIPSRYNALTDNLSRQKTSGLAPDAQVTQNIFRRWGTRDIDLFATRRSAVLPVYATLDRTDRQAAFHDAFSWTWNFRLAWIKDLDKERSESGRKRMYSDGHVLRD